jgi:hypothetical protein
MTEIIRGVLWGVITFAVVFIVDMLVRNRDKS